MNNHVQLCALFCAGVASCSPASAQENAFDFLGFTTYSASPTETTLAGKKCRVAQQRISNCSITAGAILGRARVLNLTIMFNDARLIKVSGMVVPTFYRDLIEAFETKYGQPSSVEMRSWRNRLGIEYDNEVRIWKFSDGTLELHQRGSQMNLSEFFFIANHNIPEVEPRTKPPVNF